MANRKPTGLTPDGKKIALERKLRGGLTQGDLAELAGVSEKTIVEAEAEDGKSKKYETLEAIAKGLTIAGDRLNLKGGNFKPLAANDLHILPKDTGSSKRTVNDPNSSTTRDNPHTRKINTTAIIDHMKELEWTDAELSQKAGVSIDEITRVKSGVGVERETLKKITDALGIQPWETLPDASALCVTQEITYRQNSKCVRISITTPAGTLVFFMEHNGPGRVAAEFTRKGSLERPVELLNYSEGSIHLTYLMDSTDADRLLTAFNRGQLSYLNIYDVKIVNPPRKSNPLAMLFGCSSLIIALTSLCTTFKTTACTLGLLLGATGMLFAYKSKSGWIMPIIATIISAGILCLAVCGAFDGKPTVQGPRPGNDNGDGGLRSPNPINDAKDTKKTVDKGNKEESKKEKTPEEKATEEVDRVIMAYKEAVIKSVKSWGDPSLLKETAFKTKSKLVFRALSGLTVDVHCGTETGYMGNSGDYSIFASQKAGSAIALAERKDRLVVFIPYDTDGIGIPSIVKGEDNGIGFEYRTPNDTLTTGYFVVK